MTSLFVSDTPVVRYTGGFDVETPAGHATVTRVGSTGIDAIEPLLLVTSDGQTAVYARCPPHRAEDIAGRCLGAADQTAADPDAVVDHDPRAVDLPVGILGTHAAGTRRVLGGCGWRRPTEPTDHAEAGGFLDPPAATVLDAGERLHGRGWGDWCQDEPLAETWRTVRDAGDAAVVVTARGPADSLLARSAPFELLDGATALADAVGAETVVVYLDTEDERALSRVRTAVRRYPDASVTVDVATGPSTHRATEPTMALEAIEGTDRLEARLRPPGPDTVGLDGRPTAVHTARTMAHLARALRTDSPTDTRIVTVTGDVDAPATVELPSDGTLATALDAVDAEGFKAACVGGRFGGLTPTLDIAPSPSALTPEGLGTEGVVHLLGEDRCLVEFVGKRTSFAADANCGRCVPCREGTTQLAELLRDVYDGGYDPAAIEELVGVMESTSICAFGVEAGRPARTAIEAFDAEFAAHADGDCPAGQCFPPMETPT